MIFFCFATSKIKSETLFFPEGVGAGWLIKKKTVILTYLGGKILTTVSHPPHSAWSES
jgi:hypothetical protein